ncbi:MAG: DUF86 domain-containing protein [Pseudomonadota bacterium]|nr:DUF86 domain-containing protein [Pseudomonadota bacterium]
MTGRHSYRVADYLQHILDAIGRIQSYIADLSDAAALEADCESQDAVVRNIEIIGEAANKIARADPEFVARHVEIEWTGLRGMRNKLIHDYFEVDFDLVWQTVKHDLPDLERKVRAALRELRPE